MSRSTPHKPGALCALLVLACTAACKTTNTNHDEAPLRSRMAPALCQVYENSTRGYSLRCPKREDPFRGDNEGLRVAYQVGETAPKQAEVFGDATSWLVHIPERVLPGDEVRVELAYLYTPALAVQEKLLAELVAFDAAIVDDITQALGKHGSEWKFHQPVDPKSGRFKLLEDARTRSDLPAIPELLKGMGYQKDANTSQWRPSDKTLEILNEQAAARADQGILSSNASVTAARLSAKKCSTLLGPPVPADTPKDLLASADRCLQKIHADIGTNTTNEKTGNPPGPTSLNDVTCQALLDAQAVAGFDDKTPDDDVLGAIKKMTASYDKSPNICPKVTREQLAGVQGLLTLSRHFSATQRAQEALTARMKQLAAHLAVTLELFDPGAQLLEAEAKRRDYSLSSGAVYLVGLNDLVYPVSVSFCPYVGCLRGNEQSWSSLANFGRSFSAEIGIAALTADKFDDARRRGGPGFLLGLSMQALSPFKLSGGTLVFENQETRRWQRDAYFGITLDAAKAVEMMELFGVTVPIQLKSTGLASKKTAQETQ
ncbi:hypothetical protein LXT21_40770 [Myxococcus sp. K38C18041901]|uniref:hypothetical protein n=1 Tax=Myxococcus guangdongensis TaxID=2906760 RepID=UPI0020A72221|nr:hypothetical protein [Myxococcus guangdongensis]MCP3065125.1 hypothetical protein [Myxococcus guangdongensis]